MTTRFCTALTAAAFGLLLAAPMAAPLSTPAFAQAAGMGGIGTSSTVTVRATVKSVDQQSRAVTLVGPDGKEMSFTAGPEVQNLPQVKPGDIVVATYRESVTFVLTPRGTQTPRNSISAGAARAPKGAMPAGAAATRSVVTATVVGIDLNRHTLDLVDPSGGLIHTVDVVTPQGQQAMPSIKVGDSITAVSTQVMLIGVTPGAR